MFSLEKKKKCVTYDKAMGKLSNILPKQTIFATVNHEMHVNKKNAWFPNPFTLLFLITYKPSHLFSLHSISFHLSANKPSDLYGQQYLIIPKWVMVTTNFSILLSCYTFLCYPEKWVHNYISSFNTHEDVWHT